MRLKRFMILTISAIAVIAVSLVVAACSDDCELTDDAAACVNDVIITKDDVAKRIDNLRKGFGAMVPEEDANGDGVTDVAFTNLRREVAKKLVEEELEAQEVARRNITVSDEEIDEFMRIYADESFLGDYDAMIKDFIDRGLTEQDLRDDARRTLLHEKLEAELRSDIEVTDDDALEYYQEHEAQYVQPDRITARQLIADDAVTASQALARVKAGEAFIDVIRDLSVDPEKEEKLGTLGLVAPGQLAPELEAAAFSLEVGQISEPIQVGSKWYLVAVEAKVPGYNYSFEEKKEEIKFLRGNQLYAEKWKALVREVYDGASMAYHPDYDPELIVDLGEQAGGGTAAPEAPAPAETPQS